MQINFNPSVNQVKPQFKAKFRSDQETRFALETMAQKDPVSTLALFLNMKDNKGPDLAIITTDERYWGPCYCDNPVWCYKLYEPMVHDDMRYISINSIATSGSPEEILRQYNDKIGGSATKHYQEEARKRLELLANESKEYKAMNNAIDILASQKERLRKMLSEVETKLATTKASLNEHVARQVVKKIL